MKNQILDEIRRTALENDGKPLGRVTFERETGIRYTDWYGRYWKAWGDAVAEAGFAPNSLNRRIDDDELLRRFADLARELRRIPVAGELRMKRRADKTFPNDKVFSRLGSKSTLLARVREFCIREGNYADVIPMFEPSSLPGLKGSESKSNAATMGYVYLLKSGRHFKIGRTNSVGRREYELAIQLPDKAELVHRIATDDPEGIEAYWHRRFATKRTNGEWFKLDAPDVVAFRRRKFQ